MKSHLLISILFCLFTIPLFGGESALEEDQVVLKTNEIIRGELVFQNEQVVIIQTAEGGRFQFPLSDIKTIIKDSRVIYPSGSGADVETLDKTTEDKIVLKTGEAYIGEILVRNEQVIMLRTSDGVRYQFPLKEIDSIEKISKDGKSSEYDYFSPQKTDFAMFVDVRAGASYSGKAYGWAPAIQPALILGVKNLFIQNSFLGVGAGYRIILPNDYQHMESISFLPVFVRIQQTLNKNRLSPFVEIDAGYNFALDSDLKGGTLLEFSFGYNWKLSAETNFSFGFYGGIHAFSADLSESLKFNTDSDKYRYYGKTTSQDFGLRVSLRF